MSSGPGEVRALGRAQEAEAVLQDLEHAVAVDVLAVARMRLQDREDDVLLARARQVLDPHRLDDLQQFRDRLVLQLAQVHRAAAGLELGRADDVEVFAGFDEIVRRQFVLPGTAIAVRTATATAAALVGPSAAAAAALVA